MKDQIRIGLIDDEQAGLTVLKEFISIIPGYTVSFAVSDPIAGLQMASARKADVVISDIKMPETGGLFIAGKLMEQSIPVIFCSAYPEFLRQGYLVDAVDFLLKPADYTQLENALKRAASKLPAIPARSLAFNYDTIYVKVFGSATLERIDLKAVIYFEQKGNYTYIYVKDIPIISVSTLTTVGLLLSPKQFMKVHRSYILNISHMKRIHNDTVELDEGKYIPVGRSYQRLVKSYFEFRTV